MRPLNQAAFAVANAIDLMERPSVRDLERDLSGWIAEHMTDARRRVDVPICELNADMVLLERVAAGLAQASAAFAELTRNSISVDGPSQTPAAVSDLFTESLSDLMHQSAAAVLEGMVAVDLAKRERV